MDDALGVGGGQSIRNGCTNLHCLAPRNGSLNEPVAQRLALQQFHDGIGDGALRAIVMDGEDVGMG